MINHYVPNSLKEALKILSEHDCYILAGGTDLMVQKFRSSGLLPTFDKDVLYVSEISELNYIKVDSKGNIHIGSATKYNQIEESSLVPELLKQVIREIASPNIRNMATLAGNIANASPAGDSLVPLNIFDAEVELVSVRGIRRVSVCDFVIGVRQIDRQKDELITEVIIPKFDLNTYYRKVGQRKAESITKISFAGAYKVEKGIVTDLRLAFGSVAVKVVRVKEIEKKYIGMHVYELSARVDDILNEYQLPIQPIDDQRSTKEYRKKVALNLARDFLRNIK